LQALGADATLSMKFGGKDQANWHVRREGKR